MEQLPQSSIDEQVWREHAERAKSYDGTLAAYCRLHNLDYDKFMYYRGRQVIVKPAKAPGFSKVEPVATAPAAAAGAKPKANAQLPDPKWLAELIHNLSSYR